MHTITPPNRMTHICKADPYSKSASLVPYSAARGQLFYKYLLLQKLTTSKTNQSTNGILKYPIYTLNSRSHQLKKYQSKQQEVSNTIRKEKETDTPSVATARKSSRLNFYISYIICIWWSSAYQRKRKNTVPRKLKRYQEETTHP